ncbi:hypothetical protein B0H11DRAFT_2254335 [Mycena galericulata]|nr:hypothetical protein B0H11DRAFT_2254335 [Mycena galericulata]
MGFSEFLESWDALLVSRRVMRAPPPSRKRSLTSTALSRIRPAAILASSNIAFLTGQPALASLPALNLTVRLLNIPLEDLKTVLTNRIVYRVVGRGVARRPLARRLRDLRRLPAEVCQLPQLGATGTDLVALLGPGGVPRVPPVRRPKFPSPQIPLASVKCFPPIIRGFPPTTPHQRRVHANIVSTPTEDSLLARLGLRRLPSYGASPSSSPAHASSRGLSGANFARIPPDSNMPAQDLHWRSTVYSCLSAAHVDLTRCRARLVMHIHARTDCRAITGPSSATAYSDQRFVELACLCIIRGVDSYHRAICIPPSASLHHPRKIFSQAAECPHQFPFENKERKRRHNAVVELLRGLAVCSNIQDRLLARRFSTTHLYRLTGTSSAQDNNLDQFDGPRLF